MDRVALKDDIIPLSKPIPGINGKDITEIRVSAGQVWTMVLTFAPTLILVL
jgi:hypothetical protein